MVITQVQSFGTARRSVSTSHLNAVAEATFLIGTQLGQVNSN